MALWEDRLIQSDFFLDATHGFWTRDDPQCMITGTLGDDARGINCELDVPFEHVTVIERKPD